MVGWGMAMASANVSFLALLFVLFTVKHVLADFVLQTHWMRRGKDQEHRWAAALAAHAGCHAAFTLALALAVAPALWWLGVVDFVVHCAIDRCKGVVMELHRWQPQDRWYWWSIGIDQSLHHLTGFFLAVVVVSA
jgi:hypothetical protein